MGYANNEKEFAYIAGAYGPVDGTPLLGPLIGPKLLDMIAIGYSKWDFGSPSGIFQNDGTVFPAKGRIRLLTPFCQAVRSTQEGCMRCQACDCQAIIRFTKGYKAELTSGLNEYIQRFQICERPEFGLLEEDVYCYGCHGGLFELIRWIKLELTGNWWIPVGAIWAGQNKLANECMSDECVMRLAEDIGYREPGKLVQYYKDIKGITPEKLLERSRSLAETAHPIEESASIAFHTNKQSQFDKLTTEVLNCLRKELHAVKSASSQSIQRQVYTGMKPVLKEFVVNIGNCFSVLCEIPEKSSESENEWTRINVVVHAGDCGVKSERPFHVKIRRRDVDMLLEYVTLREGPRLSTESSLSSSLITKMKHAVGISDAKLVMLASVPAIHGHILWIAILRERCNVLTPDDNSLLEFERMVKNVHEGIAQLVETAYLLAKQQDTMKDLENYAHQLEQKDRDNKLLFQSIAHQVAMPILGLKQAAYILNRGFSKAAYDGFRACLKEYERGCRNFKMYQTITMDYDRRLQNLRVRDSFDIMEIVRKSYERVKPYSESTGRRFVIKDVSQKGHNLRHVNCNQEAIMECFVNVFHNAIKYSLGNNPIHVEIFQDGKVMIVTRVTNLGIEIPAKDRDDIFMETARSETAKAVKIDGSGIGLFISRKLVEFNGGSVMVESCKPAMQTLKDGTPLWKTTFVISLEC